jgi:hypothetical protein
MTARARAKRALGALIGGSRAEFVSMGVQDRWSWSKYRALPCGRKSAAHLKALHNTRAGRCFVIGNGPSLNKQNLALLRGEVTLALNRGYLLSERIGAPPTYLVAVNRYVIEQFGDAILDTPTLKFISWNARGSVPCRDDVVFVRQRLRPAFYGDLHREGVWEGATVTFVALQLAYHLGFHEVILIGVDHVFATRGSPNELVTSRAEDPNHFDGSYFGPGVRWQLPDLATSEIGYRMAAQAYVRDGRRVLNATAGGALEVFPRVDFASQVGQTD